MRTGASGKPSWVCFTDLIIRTHTTLKIPRIHGLEWHGVSFIYFFLPQNGEFSQRSENRIFLEKKSGAKCIKRGFLLEKVCKTCHILRRKKKWQVAIFRQSVSGGRQNKAASLKTFVLCWLTSSRIWLISSCVDDRHLLDKIVGDLLSFNLFHHARIIFGSDCALPAASFFLFLCQIDNKSSYLFVFCFCCVFCSTSSWFVGLGIPCSETVKFCR